MCRNRVHHSCSPLKLDGLQVHGRRTVNLSVECFSRSLWLKLRSHFHPPADKSQVSANIHVMMDQIPSFQSDCIAIQEPHVAHECWALTCAWEQIGRQRSCVGDWRGRCSRAPHVGPCPLSVEVLEDFHSQSHLAGICPQGNKVLGHSGKVCLRRRLAGPVVAKTSSAPPKCYT